MKVKRQELLNSINQIQPGLASKDIIEQSTNIIFKNKEIRTYNDEISVCTPTNIPFEGAVPSIEFSKYLSKLKDDEIEISPNEDELIIKSKKGEAGIRFDTDIKLPLDEVDIPEKWLALPKDFCKAVKFCMFCTSKDMTKLVLTCLNVSDDTITACDNFRVIQYQMATKIKKSFLLPYDSAVHLMKYNPVEYAVGDGWLHFINDADVIFSCRTYSLEYPDMSAFLKLEGVEIPLPRTLEDMLEEVEIFAKQDNKDGLSVDVKVSDGKVTIKANSDIGWAKNSKKIKYNGDDILFTVSPTFLLEASKLMNSVIVSEDKLKIEGEDFTHIACLQINKD